MGWNITYNTDQLELLKIKETISFKDDLLSLTLLTGDASFHFSAPALIALKRPAS